MSEPQWTQPAVVDVPFEEPDENADTKRHLLWLARAVGYLVYAYVVVVEIILAFGFFLLLFGANPTSGFVQWMYRNLDRVMDPFRGIFTPIQLGSAEGGEVQSVFETSVLFAMIVYGLLAIAVHALISWLTGRMARLQREDYEYRRRRAAEVAAQRAAYQQQAASGTAPATGIATNTPTTAPHPPQQPPTVS
jgi:YGGT family